MFGGCTCPFIEAEMFLPSVCMLLMWTSTGVKPGGGDGAVCPYVGTPDSRILVNVAWAVDGIIRCGMVEKPVALAVLGIEEAHNVVGLGVPELELCKGLTELLRAFRSEFGVVDVLRDNVVGPNRPCWAVWASV